MPDAPRPLLHIGRLLLATHLSLIPDTGHPAPSQPRTRRRPPQGLGDPRSTAAAAAPATPAPPPRVPAPGPAPARLLSLGPAPAARPRAPCPARAGVRAALREGRLGARASPLAPRGGGGGGGAFQKFPRP